MCVGAALDQVTLCDLLVEERVEAIFATASRVDLSHGAEFGKRDRTDVGGSGAERPPHDKLGALSCSAHVE